MNLEIRKENTTLPQIQQKLLLKEQKELKNIPYKKEAESDVVIAKGDGNKKEELLAKLKAVEQRMLEISQRIEELKVSGEDIAEGGAAVGMLAGLGGTALATALLSAQWILVAPIVMPLSILVGGLVGGGIAATATHELLKEYNNLAQERQKIIGELNSLKD